MRGTIKTFSLSPPVIFANKTVETIGRREDVLFDFQFAESRSENWVSYVSRKSFSDVLAHALVSELTHSCFAVLFFFFFSRDDGKRDEVPRKFRPSIGKKCKSCILTFCRNCTFIPFFISIPSSLLSLSASTLGRWLQR